MRRYQLAALAAGLFAVSAAQAAVVVSQDFEGLVTPNYGAGVFTAPNQIIDGYYGTGTEGSWYGWNDGPSTSNTRAYSGTQSVVFTPQVDQNNAFVSDRQLLGYNNVDGGPTTGAFELSLWLYQETNGHPNDGYVYYEATNKAARGSQEVGVKIKDGVLSIGLFNTPNQGAVTLPDDKWVGIKLLGDLTTQLFSTYVDTGSGWTAVDLNRTFTASTVLGSGSLDTFFFNSNGGLDGPNTSVYIDKLYLGSPQPVPEPTALASVLLGGVALLRRRRH